MINHGGNEMRYGYARISTGKQKADRQLEELEKYDLQKIYVDTISGSKFNRPNYNMLRDEILREGDELFIKEVDRLGRNKQQTLDELKLLKDKGVIIRILEIPTTLAQVGDSEQNKMMLEMMNNMLIEMYTTFAQLELEKIRTRTKEALQVKKDNGDTLGRPVATYPSNWSKVYKQWKDNKITGVQAMQLVEMKKTTFYKMVKQYENEM